jgi:hypothetical protein
MLVAAYRGTEGPALSEEVPDTTTTTTAATTTACRAGTRLWTWTCLDCEAVIQSLLPRPGEMSSSGTGRESDRFEVEPVAEHLQGTGPLCGPLRLARVQQIISYPVLGTRDIVEVRLRECAGMVPVDIVGKVLELVRRAGGASQPLHFASKFDTLPGSGDCRLFTKKVGASFDTPVGVMAE